MNPRTTWFLVVLAGVLFLFIQLVERHTQPTGAAPVEPPRLLAVRAIEVTNLQLRATNQLVLRAEQTNGGWHLNHPIAYPAASERIARWLELLEKLPAQRLLSLHELAGDQRTVADFGLEAPPMSLVLYHAGRRSEVLFGSKTALGDQVYVQVQGSPDIYVTDAELLDRLPRRADEWRDRSLLTLDGLMLDRLEVRAAGRGFALVLDTTNRAFYLTKPTPARADGPKVDALLRTIGRERIIRFVADAPATDLEPYGLQPPVAELVLGKGTNDLVTVEFGKSPTNETELVYARRLSHSNIVLVSRTLLDTLLASHTELRDRHLLAFVPDEVEVMEVLGPDGFGVRRQTNGTWTTTDAKSWPVDTGLVRDWMDRLSRLQGTVEKDVVTDFTPYGLVTPERQIVLRRLAPPAEGTSTNLVLAQLDLGAAQDGKVFARRPEDTSAYSVSLDALATLPNADWQLRDRRVFRFTTNQVASLTIRHNGYERKLLRTPAGLWSLAPGSQGMINTFAVEEMVFRLGELRANAWVDRGETNRARHGFTDTGYRLTVELKDGDEPVTRILEFGRQVPSVGPLALTLLDDETWIFEFPVALYWEMLQYLSNPPQRARGTPP